MSLSSIAVEQREKEAKSLNAFLAFSLIGSLALHIGVLSLGIGKFLSKAPEIKNEPIEIAIVELPTPQKLESKPEEVQGKSGAGSDRAVLSSSSGSEGFGVASGGGASLPKRVAPSETIDVQPIPQQNSSPKRISKVISLPLQNQKVKPEVSAKKIVTQPKIVTPSSQPVAAKPVETPAQTQPAKIVTPSKPVAKPSDLGERDRSLQINNQKLSSVLAEAKNAREQASRTNNVGKITAEQSKIAANLRNQSGSGVGTSNGLGNSTSNELSNNGTGNGTSINNGGTGNGTRSDTSINNGGTGSGTGRGTGNGTSRGTGNGTNINNSGTGRGNNNLQSGSTVATGGRNIERQTPPKPTESNTFAGSPSGRLACRTCSKPKYPENARKRKLEGKAEISVDVDSKGNVTNVRLARTSGHAELDKAAVEQARNWKFNAPNGAAQGVTAKVDFAIEGSKKSRQNRERRRQRAARKQSVASSQNPPTTPVVKTPARQNTNTALKRSLRRQRATTGRRVDTLPPRQAFDQPRGRQQPGGQTRLRNTLRRVQSSTQTRIRRSPATSPSQSKLRQSLRSYQQKSPSTPNANEP